MGDRGKLRVLDLFYDGHKVFYDAKGYACVWVEGKSRKVHVIEWEKHNGPKPSGFDVHHKDENKGNFALSNLELLSVSDHQRIHAGWVREGGEWISKPCTKCGATLPLDRFYARGRFTPSAKCKTCHNVDAKKWVDNNRDKRRQSALSYYYRSKANG